MFKHVRILPGWYLMEFHGNMGYVTEHSCIVIWMCLTMWYTAGVYYQ